MQQRSVTFLPFKDALKNNASCRYMVYLHIFCSEIHGDVIVRLVWLIVISEKKQYKHILSSK
jgi:hypothetical protein